jgi:predicted dehydrogenase
MLRVGIAGIGFMGMIHYLAYQQVAGVKVTAIASRDPKKRAGDWRGIQGNFGPPGEEMELGDVETHETIEELFANPNVDIVDVTLPPFRHAEVAIAALNAGKHVFCEKPLTLDAVSAAEVVAAAKKHDRILLVGHVLQFFPE